MHNLTLLPALAALLVCLPAAATNYYIASDGSDDDPGTLPESPWRTIAQANGAAIEPGDSVLLRRGDSWREQLIPHSGAEGSPVTYGAYGEGSKPVLLGSIDRSDPADWREERPGIWVSVEPEPHPDAENLLPNGDFGKGAESWSLYCEHGAQAAGVVAEGAYRISCSAAGEGGSDIQFYTMPFSVRRGTMYRLDFQALATEPLSVVSPRMMSSGPPWHSYASQAHRANRVTTEWQSFTQYYWCTTTAADGRLTFFLGDALPAGAELLIDSLQLQALAAGPELLLVDVGNIIFGDEESCGVKVFDEAALDAMGEFYYDEDADMLKIRCDRNPADQWGRIECAMRRHIIDESGASWVVYENLDLKYGGAHGIGGANTHHIVVRDCDLSYIGGGDQMGGDRTVRYGNGIEFWANAHDNLVERCRLWEIYDAALTNQSSGADVVQRDIIYRNNLIWNCEYSFEYWNRPESSVTDNVRFEHNTCLGSGFGWGHTQRPDPSGRHLCFYSSPAQATGLTVTNNVFFEAKTNAFYAPGWSREQIDALVIDANCWYQSEGDMVSVAGELYPMDGFDAYRDAFSKEPRSLVADPLLVDAGARDLRPGPGSPLIDSGIESEHEADFAGAPRPQGDGPDIGAYEAR